MARESPVTLGFGLDGQVAQDLMLDNLKFQVADHLLVSVRSLRRSTPPRIARGTCGEALDRHGPL